jgi:hypothetical protein
MEHSSQRWYARPDWWTAIFSGILAVITVTAVWYARDQIRVTRDEVEDQITHAHDENQAQIEETHKEEQIQHLLAMVSEFDQDPMATYRRELAKKRLEGKPDDPFEMYRELDFFETVNLLVDRGYLNEKDVWNQFRWWVFNLNSDDAIQKGIAYEQGKDKNEYAGFISLVKRLQRIDEEQHGTDAHPAPRVVRDFYLEESHVISGGK